jgi:hypothetical protein
MLRKRYWKMRTTWGHGQNMLVEYLTLLLMTLRVKVRKEAIKFLVALVT